MICKSDVISYFVVDAQLDTLAFIENKVRLQLPATGQQKWLVLRCWQRFQWPMAFWQHQVDPRAYPWPQLT